MSAARKPPVPLPDFTESPLDSTRAFQGGFLTLYKDTVRLPDGASAHREYLRHPGAAMMIPFLDDATRVVPYCAFCLSENTAAFLPVFKQALLRLPSPPLRGGRVRTASIPATPT